MKFRFCIDSLLFKSLILLTSQKYTVIKTSLHCHLNSQQQSKHNDYENYCNNFYKAPQLQTLPPYVEKRRNKPDVHLASYIQRPNKT